MEMDIEYKTIQIYEEKIAKISLVSISKFSRLYKLEFATQTQSRHEAALCRGEQKDSPSTKRNQNGTV